jgi:hypothetical protein
MVSEISCLSCDDLRGLRLPTVLCYVLIFIICWRIRLTHASSKTKDLTSVTCRSPAVDGQSCHFRGSASHLVGDLLRKHSSLCEYPRAASAFLNGYRSCARKSPISDSENKGVGFETARWQALYPEFPSLGLSECSAQTWDVNSLSRCNSKLRIISSNDLPVGAPEGLNRQPHSEQPKP